MFPYLAFRIFANRHLLTIALITFFLSGINSAVAQIAGGNGGAGGAGTGGTGTGAASGVIIDSKGLMKNIVVSSDGKLARRRLAAARNELGKDLNTFSPLRKVSLVRLERACEKFAKDQAHVTPDLQYLAGLQRIDYVFVYPEEQDIVIAGPAEGFAEDGAGRTLGFTTGRPPLRLDDLIVALRAVQQGNEVGCSIDPRPENVAKFKKFQTANRGASTAAVARNRFARLAKIMGNQDVTIWGIPADSHFARTIVEADYLMKRISSGLMKVRVRGFKTQLDLTRPGDDMATRWWFTPLYEPFTTTPDGNAIHLAGQRAQLWAENEILTPDGQRIGVGIQRSSTDRYTKLFTEKFPELAEAVPAFAELQTLIDLLTVSTMIQEKRLAERVGWSMSLFLDPERATLSKWNVPREVESTVSMKFVRGKTLMGMVSGGVIIDPVRTFRQTQLEEDDGQLSDAQTEARKQLPQEDRWWWD